MGRFRLSLRLVTHLVNFFIAIPTGAGILAILDSGDYTTSIPSFLGIAVFFVLVVEIVAALETGLAFLYPNFNLRGLHFWFFLENSFLVLLAVGLSFYLFFFKQDMQIEHARQLVNISFALLVANLPWSLFYFRSFLVFARNEGIIGSY